MDGAKSTRESVNLTPRQVGSVPTSVPGMSFSFGGSSVGTAAAQEDEPMLSTSLNGDQPTFGTSYNGDKPTFGSAVKEHQQETVEKESNSMNIDETKAQTASKVTTKEISYSDLLDEVTVSSEYHLLIIKANKIPERDLESFEFKLPADSLNQILVQLVLVNEVKVQNVEFIDLYQDPKKTVTEPSASIDDNNSLTVSSGSSLKPSNDTQSLKSPIPTPAVNPLAILSSKIKSQWECTTCLVINKEADLKCIACETERPGSSASVIKTASSTQSGQFSFGSMPASVSVPTSESSSLSFGSANSTFTFGAPPAKQESDKSTGPSNFGFTFGAQTPAKSESKISFGVAQTPGFTFGQGSTGFEFGK